MNAHELFTEYNALKFTPIIYLTKSEADKYGLNMNKLPLPAPTPVFLEDAIMAYIWIKDMPECFEKKYKRLRCLLRFYLLLINPKPELLEQTRNAIQTLGDHNQPLVTKEEDILPKIKKLFNDMITNTPDDYDQKKKDGMMKALQEVEKLKRTLKEDKEHYLDAKNKLEDHPISKAFKHLNTVLEATVHFNF